MQRHHVLAFINIVDPFTDLFECFFFFYLICSVFCGRGCQNVLREEVKEKLTWSVDRSSPSNKIRDLMKWSKDILNDIYYQRKILSNPIATFFTKNWSVISCVSGFAYPLQFLAPPPFLPCISYVDRWRSGSVLALRSIGRGVESQPLRCRVQLWASC